MPLYVLALVDCPGVEGEGYTYQIPMGLEVCPGDVLAVPFGRQVVGAIALELSEELPPELEPGVVREVVAVVATGVFAPEYWALLVQVAEYYCTTLVQVVRIALPPGMLGRSQRRVRLNREEIPPGAAALVTPVAARLLAWWQGRSGEGDCAWRFVERQFSGRAIAELIRRGWVTSYLAAPQPPQPKVQQAVVLRNVQVQEEEPLTPRQREILGILARRGGDLWLTELLQLAKTTTATVRSLESKGWVSLVAREVLRQPQGPRIPPQAPKTLTPAQEVALAALRALGPGEAALLHGVTGSGKTEVYLQAIAPVIAAGRSALLLVPEIGLTPQLGDRLRGRFGDRVLVYHSGLSEGERYDAWRQMLEGRAWVVVGTRSAVFAPLPNLGLIVLDEEHDSSFKQDQPAPCYHARQVAQWRAQRAGCPVVLGSATPSLESWVAAQGEGEAGKRLVYLTLGDRINARPLPQVEVVDMRREFKDGNRSLFSRRLRAGLEGLREDDRAILFIHRRGHSTFVSCRSCGYVIECPHCDISLAYHQTHAAQHPLLRCHFCNYTQLHPAGCPECSSPYLKHFGSGSQRVARELEREFPHLKVLRYDRDTTRAKDAHRLLIDRFVQGEAQVLVGTQMLAKGLDLPQVTLVGIVAADGLLYLSDYRAMERAVQTLIQVAGRAGRGEEPGQVVLQTYSPEEPAIAATRDYAYGEFLAAECDRRAALNYPPVGRLICLRFSGLDGAAVQTSAERVAAHLAPEAAIDPATYTLLGPAPAQVERVARRFRWQLLIRMPPGGQRPAGLMQVRSLCLPGVALTIDVDPLTLL